MSLLIPDDVLAAARISAEEIRLEVAVLLFEREKLTLGQASRFAGMSRFRFQHLLAARGIGPHYDVADFEEDLAVVRPS